MTLTLAYWKQRNHQEASPDVLAQRLGFVRNWLIQSFVNPGKSNTHLPDAPRKLADRINDRPDDLHDSEMIVGNGDIELRSNHPVSVVEYFLATHASEWSKATYTDYSYDLTRFLEYCEYASIDDLSTLSPTHLTGLKQWRGRDENVALATLHGQLADIRVFIRACESIEIVEDDLADEIAMPNLDDSDIVSSTRLKSDSSMTHNNSAQSEIEISGVDEIYGRDTSNPVQALEDISLEIYENEFISIIGPSGCGKTTLLKCIGDITKPTSGDIQIGDGTAADARQNNLVSFFFQEDVLLPWRSVMENVLYPLEIQDKNTSNPEVQ